MTFFHYYGEQKVVEYYWMREGRIEGGTYMKLYRIRVAQKGPTQIYLPLLLLYSNPM